MKANTLPVTMAVAWCPVCKQATPQSFVWSYATVIHQHCYDCLQGCLNLTYYSRTTTKHQKQAIHLANELMRGSHRHAFIYTVVKVPKGATSLWEYRKDLDDVQPAGNTAEDTSEVGVME